MAATPLRRIVKTVLQGGAHNDVQLCTPAGGAGVDTFNLTWDSGGEDEETTSEIAFDASAQDVEDALIALTAIPAAAVSVTGADGGPFTIEFQGDLGFQAIPLLVGAGTGMTAPVTSVIEGFDLTEVGGAGVEKDCKGAQFVVLAIQETPDDASGDFLFEISVDDGENWDEFDMIDMSTGLSASDYNANDVATAFYAQLPSGPCMVRCSYTADPFLHQVPVATLVAFG